MGKAVAIVDSGSGNLRSVRRALEVAGGAVQITSDPDEVRRADRVVVPGQGAFADCVRSLSAGGMDQALREVAGSGRPFLGICLGLQVLFEESEEHGPVPGLGLLKGRVRRFPGGGLKVPHIGWNQVRICAAGDPLYAGIPDQSHFYFIHSYFVQPADELLVTLWCDYGQPFAAAIRSDNLSAVQFHPEKSQALGLRLLENFLAIP